MVHSETGGHTLHMCRIRSYKPLGQSNCCNCCIATGGQKTHLLISPNYLHGLEFKKVAHLVCCTSYTQVQLLRALLQQDQAPIHPKRPCREDISVVGVGDHAVVVENAADGLLRPVSTGLLH